MDYCISVSSWRSSDETQYDITFLFKYMYIYMMKPDSVLQMIRLNQPPIVGINSTATEFIFYKLSVTTSNYIELFVLEIELKFHNLFR